MYAYFPWGELKLKPACLGYLERTGAERVQSTGPLSFPLSKTYRVSLKSRIGPKTFDLFFVSAQSRCNVFHLSCEENWIVRDISFLRLGFTKWKIIHFIGFNLTVNPWELPFFDMIFLKIWPLNLSCESITYHVRFSSWGNSQPTVWERLHFCVGTPQ